MRHLYASLVQVTELVQTRVNGSATYAWSPVTAMVDPIWGVPGQLKCRIDLQFIRPGRDAPMPIQAGRAPDRQGILICDVNPNLKAGQRVTAIDGPVTGVFELRETPDPIVGFSLAHHIEVGLIEVAQALQGVFPGTEPNVP